MAPPARAPGDVAAALQILERASAERPSDRTGVPGPIRQGELFAHRHRSAGIPVPAAIAVARRLILGRAR